DGERRARDQGRRSVLNSGHPEADFERVTERQRRELLPRLAALLDGTERLVLDLGCGPGRFTADLARLVSGHAIGVDVATPLLDLAPPDERVEDRLIPEGPIDLPGAPGRG